MTEPLPSPALNQLFTAARSHKSWQFKPLPEQVLHQLYDLMRWGPTSNNSSPARLVFASTKEARAGIMEAINEGNRPKVADASVITIICADDEHWLNWQRLSPHKNLAALFEHDVASSRQEAERNCMLQSGYFIIAARALGLDVFPLTGFDGDKIRTSALIPQTWRPLLICCIGIGDPKGLRPRAQRLEFNDACIIL